MTQSARWAWIVTFVVAGGIYFLLGGAKDRRAAPVENAHA